MLLDNCINALYEGGAIGTSSGTIAPFVPPPIPAPLIGLNITTGSPIIGTPTLATFAPVVLTADDITTGSPVIGTPDMSVPPLIPGYSGSAYSVWRTYITAENGGTTTGIYEQQLRSIPGGSNNLSGGSSSASSYNGLDSTTYNTTHIYDGNNTTSWLSSSVSADYGDYWTFNADSPFGVLEATITWSSLTASQAPKNIWFAYQGSVGFEVAFGVTGQTSWSGSETRTFTDPQLDPRDAHPYWGVVMYDAATNSFILSGLQMRASSGGPDQCSGGTVIGDGAWTSLSNLFDGDSSTNASKSCVSAFAGYHFPSPVFVQEIVLSVGSGFSAPAPGNFTIVCSEDGFNWSQAWPVTDISSWSTGESKTFTAPYTVGSAPDTTSARYWRFSITTFSAFPSIAELQFAKLGYPMATPSAYLSSSNNSELGGGTGGAAAGYAFDGDDSTAWFPSSASSGEWVGVDFGTAVNVNVVRLRGRGGQYPTSGNVQYSSDGSTWTTAWSLSGLTGSGYVANVQGEHPCPFPDPNKVSSGDKVIWQLRGTASSTADAFSIGEIQLRTIAGFALSNKISSAIKPFATGTIGGFPPENAIDGNNTSLWAGSMTVAASIGFELTRHYTIAELALMERSDGGSDYQSPKDFALYYTSDGITYTLAHSWTGQSGFTVNTFKTFSV